MSGVDPILPLFVAGLLTGASEALLVVVTRTVSNASPAQDLTDCAGSLFSELWGFWWNEHTHDIVGLLRLKAQAETPRMTGLSNGSFMWVQIPQSPTTQETDPINTTPIILRLTMPRRWLKHGGHANQGHLKSPTITEKVVSGHPHLGAWSYAEVSECIGVPKPSAKNCLPSLSESQSFERESVRIPFQQPVLVFAVVQRSVASVTSSIHNL